MISTFRVSNLIRGLAPGLVVALLLQTGCASYFKRRECEATNWFAYGQKVAMSGRRLTGDQFVGDCHRAEAEIGEGDLDRGFKQGMFQYCEPAQVFMLGKNGEAFSAEMCDGANLKILAERHAAGVVEYCQKSNAYVAGAGGRPYNGICPKNLEGAFLPEFRRGRKKYLTVVVAENEKKINGLELETMGLQNERNMYAMQEQNALVPTMVVHQVMGVSGSFHQEYNQEITPAQRNSANDYHWRAQSAESQISSKRLEQSRLRDRNEEIRIELVTLDTFDGEIK